jgi:hypothetical protein
LDEFVEPVEQQRDPTPGDQVSDLRVGDIPDVQPGQVLPDDVEQVRPFSRVRNSQQRLQPADPRQTRSWRIRNVLLTEVPGTVTTGAVLISQRVTGPASN